VKRATNLPLSKDAPSVPTFADVARLVAGTDAPPWLAAHFERWAPSLMLDRCIEDKQPKKSEMKKRLADVRDAALLLRDALNDTPIREFLEIAPLGPIESSGVLEHMLQDLAERAKRAAASSALSTEDGKTRPGRTRATPIDASSAKLFCAALIAEAWTYFHGGDPPPRNQDAAGAAHTLWRASGGETKGWGNDPLNSWRYYFKEVQAPALGKVRKECRRHLEEAERLSTILSGK
jgi:hypothetical protein